MKLRAIYNDMVELERDIRFVVVKNEKPSKHLLSAKNYILLTIKCLENNV